MKTYQKALRNLGINGCGNIPLTVLLSQNMTADAYSIPKEDIEKLNALRDIIQEYNSKDKLKRTIQNSSDVVSLMLPKLKNLDHEELWVIYLTNKGNLIDKQRITIGSLDCTVCDNRRILKQALSCNAGGIIMIHNHPSGNPVPSQADIKMTEKLKQACDTFDIRLLDHVIISNDNHYCFSEDKVITNIA